MAAKLYAEGANYRFETADSIVRCVIWSRPDLSYEEGAQLAEQTVNHFNTLAQRPASEVAGAIFDVEQAPPVCGPKTQAAIAQMVAPWEKAGRPLVMIVGNAAVKQLQMRRLISEHAPRFGRTVSTHQEAIELIGTVLRGTQRS